MEMLMIIVQCTIKNPDEIFLGSTIKKDIKSLLNEVKVLIDGFVQESPGLLSGKSVKRSYPTDELIGYVEKIW